MKIAQSIISEQWRDLPGYWGEYQVSNRGRVKRLEVFKNTRRQKRKIFSPNPKPDRYLNGNINQKTVYFHTLVMSGFKGPKPKKFVVNHKNGIKWENHIENMEYCSYGDNIRHGWRVLNRQPAHIPPYKHVLSKAIAQIDSSGNQVAIFDSINQAMKLTGIHATSIVKVCKGKMNHSGGYKWIYV